MLLLQLLEFSFVVIFLALLITQVVIPAIKGTRLFPLFNPKRREAFEDLTRARDDHEVEDLEKSVEEERHSSGGPGHE